MFNRISITFLLLLGLVWLSACAESAPVAAPETASNVTVETAEESEIRGVLRLPHSLVWGGKESLDPTSPVGFANATVLLYDRLVRLDQNGLATPELAVSWQPNADATAWTFTLRDDVTFHDGQPFTSADAAYTFEHILDPASEAPLASTLGLIETIETPDDQTIIFKLAQGHADFPLLVGNYRAAIIPADSAETIGKSGIGTGPFQLETLNAEGVTVFQANDNYWKGTPGLAGIELLSLPDIEGYNLAAQAGQIDLQLGVTGIEAANFEGQEGFEILTFPSGRWSGLVMHTDTPPFDDARVRKAMRLVADRQAMISLTLDGQGTLTCDTPVAPTDPYRLETDCSQDIEQAKSLLAEAGYADGLDVTLYTAETGVQLIPLAEVYQQQAALADINVTLEVVPADSFWSEVWLVEPFSATFWQERPADQVLNENMRSTAPWNESRFENSEFDQLLDEARTELDFETRREKYQAAQQLVVEEGGHLIPFHINQFYVMRSSISGVPAQNWQDLEWHLISKND